MTAEPVGTIVESWATTRRQSSAPSPKQAVGMLDKSMPEGAADSAGGSADADGATVTDEDGPDAAHPTASNATATRTTATARGMAPGRRRRSFGSSVHPGRFRCVDGRSFMGRPLWQLDARFGSQKARNSSLGATSAASGGFSGHNGLRVQLSPRSARRRWRRRDGAARWAPRPGTPQPASGTIRPSASIVACRRRFRSSASGT